MTAHQRRNVWTCPASCAYCAGTALVRDDAGRDWICPSAARDRHRPTA